MKEKKVSYEIPGGIILRNVFNLTILPLVIIIALVVLLVLGVIPQRLLTEYAILAFFVFLFAITYTFLLYSPSLPDFLRKIANSAIENWILENVKCPDCDGSIKTCTCITEIPPDWAPLGVFDRICEVQCSKCNKKFLFSSNLSTLYFVSQSKEGALDKYKLSVKLVLAILLFMLMLFVALLLFGIASFVYSFMH
jgi:small-conductance mechanosensitive channel